MQKKKQILKSVLKTIASVSLTVIIALGVVFAPAISVKAETVLIETISEGETWRENWSSSTPSMSLKLDIDETNFYNVTVTDHKQTGAFLIYILDYTTEDYVGYIVADEDGKIVSSYTSDNIFLVKDHQYELVCCYINIDDLESNIAADISITFNSSDVTLEQLPNCSLASSNLSANFTSEDDLLWVKYKTTSAGDYSFNFGNLHAYISVFNSITGEQVYTDVDTEYLYDYYNYTWDVRDKLVFNLDSEVEYYFLISSYEASQTKLSITKNNDIVTNITPYQALYDINSFWSAEEIDFSCFNYKITYKSGATEILDDYTDVLRNGYELPNVEFLGESVYVNGDWYLCSGDQLLTSTWGENTTNNYVYVKSLTEYFSYLGVTNENKKCSIEYEDDDEYTYYWRVKVSSSGIYGVWTNSSDTFRSNFDYYEIDFVDNKNNEITYNEALQGWPLVANTEYVLMITYRYDETHTYNDIIFWLQKEADLAGWKSDANGWWYQNSDGSYIANNWLNDGGVWYYFNASGYAVTGWQQIGGTWYYFHGSGAMATGWQQIGGTWYYFHSSGAMATGWQQIGGTWYYFHGSGAMATGWQQIGGTWYYFHSSGAMATGWQYIGGYWYYFYNSGAMAANCWIDGCWLNASGAWA